jgi:rhamnogalacturonyl hydrolase YesR
MEHHSLSVNATLQALAARAPDLWMLDACGVTRSQVSIPALVHREAYVPYTSRLRVLLLGGLSGRSEDVALAAQVLDTYLAERERLGVAVALSAVPCGNPDGLTQGVAPDNGVGGQPASGYPPREHFFDDAQNPEQRYLWRWIGLQAPDLILEVRTGSPVLWEVSATALPLAAGLQAARVTPPDSCIAALGADLANGLTPNGVGSIPGVRLTTTPERLDAELNRLWLLLQHTPLASSPARRRLEARRTRQPLQIARSLATVYGHTLDPVVYTQGMSISARLRLARMDPTYDDPVPSIVRLVEPYVSGSVSMFKEPAAPSAMAGLIWGMQLTEVTRDRRYADLVIQVAERYRPGAAGGAPPPSDPDFRTEDMFMNGAMLSRAFRLTGNMRYLDLLTNFLLEARIQQDDGLFWHCRSAPYYWGRGNGFALLGFSETLSFLPPEHPDYATLLALHVRQLEALRQRQLPSGMLAQVLNVPGSYHEFTVTCMFGFALARALRRGWVEAPYRPALERAWQGVVERIDDAGGLVDCCTNTGVQTSLQAYIDRPAIFGRDDRGGAMAMWLALEMEQLARAPRR